MDVSRYEFECQKALHQGLRYARSLGHGLLEVEHVALAMIRANTVPDKTVGDGLRAHLELQLGRAPRVFGTIKIEFGRRLDQALDAAEAVAEGQKRLVELTDLWSALCRQSTAIQNFLRTSQPGVAEQSQDEARAEPVARASGDAGGRPAAGAAPNANAKSNAKESKAKAQDAFPKELSLFTVDLTAQAERGELDPVVGRDSEVRRVLEILGRKKKNNPLLIGEPGVGKSAIAEALALRIAEGQVPESMRGKRVLSLDLGGMLAGAKFRGEFEERLKNLIKALAKAAGQVILFIDEIHMLVGAGNHEGGADAANLLKPALARGELQCLGATTLDEYRKYIEKDPALERRFQPLLVEEPNRDQALAILRGLKGRYEVHHGVQIDDEALTAAVDLSMRYLAARKLPDKAIDLMDEAASRLKLQIDSVPRVLDELTSQIAGIEIERKAVGKARSASQIAALSTLDVRLEKAKIEHTRIEALWRRHQQLLNELKDQEKGRQEAQTLFEQARVQADFDFAARLQYGEMPRLEEKGAGLRQELAAMQSQHAFLRQAVGAREIAEVVAAWSRIPVGRLLEDDGRKLLDLGKRLGQRVYGQDKALEQIARAVKRARVGVNDPRRPLGVFLFLGTTGVGKTQTAKTLAAELFGSEDRLIRIDMSEFMEQHTTARLVGAPPGYVGFGEGGELTEAVRHQPYSVVLLDEIEKAHPRVLDLMLQTFDDGRLTDGRGQTVDFRQTLIIMTSNLALSGLADPEAASEDELRASLATALRPELVNRIDEVMVFRKLGRRHLDHLLDRLLDELNGRLDDRQLRISLGTKLRDRLVAPEVLGPFGGRALRRSFEAMVVDAVSERILAVPALATGAWTLELDRQFVAQWLPEQRGGYYLKAKN